MSFDGNFGLVQFKAEHGITLFQRKCRPERNCGMPAKRNLGFGRKVTHPPGVAGRCSKCGFRVTDLRGDPSHLVFARERIGNQDAGWIAADITIGKCRNSNHIHIH